MLNLLDKDQGCIRVPTVRVIDGASALGRDATGT